MKLYSAWYCPFAQRTWMSLLHKKVTFDYVEIDPYQQTPEWLELSKGTAQVPVIVVENENIIDSTEINAQLDTLLPETKPLFSRQTDKKREQEKQIEHINNNIVPYFYRYLKSHIEGEYKEESKRNLLMGMAQFAESIDPSGPYFYGDKLSAVDISYFPFAYRIHILLGHYRGFTLPDSGEIWKKYQQWYNKMLALTAFKESATNHSDYEQRLIDIYYPYSQGGGQTDVTELPDK